MTKRIAFKVLGRKYTLKYMPDQISKACKVLGIMGLMIAKDHRIRHISSINTIERVRK